MNISSANELIQSLYMFSSGLEGTESFLLKMSRAFKSHIVFGVAFDPVTTLFDSPSYIGVDQKTIEDFYGYYADKNVLVKAGLHDLIKGKVVDGDDYVPRSELVKTEYYCDYLRRVGAENNIGFMCRHPGNLFYSMFISRDRASGAFSSDEKALAELIKPHFESALQLKHHVNSLKRESALKSFAIDHLRTGICFLGDNLKLIDSNLVAREIISKSDALTSQYGFLSAGDQASSELQSLLHQMSTGCLNANTQLSLNLTKDNLEHHLAVFKVHDADQLSWLDSSTTRYVLFLGWSLVTSQKCQKFLRNEYSITEKELELIDLVLCGKSLGQAAILLGISPETVRTHMKHIFNKMDVHSQAQLAIQISMLNSIR